MHKIKTLFDISPEPEASEPQDSRITLNEILILNKAQAVTRYNMGISSIRKAAENCGAIVRIGRRVGYLRPNMDEYFENIAE